MCINATTVCLNYNQNEIHKVDMNSCIFKKLIQIMEETTEYLCIDNGGNADDDDDDYDVDVFDDDGGGDDDDYDDE